MPVTPFSPDDIFRPNFGAQSRPMLVTVLIFLSFTSIYSLAETTIPMFISQPVVPITTAQPSPSPNPTVCKIVDAEDAIPSARQNAATLAQLIDFLTTDVLILTTRQRDALIAQKQSVNEEAILSDTLNDLNSPLYWDAVSRMTDINRNDDLMKLIPEVQKAIVEADKLIKQWGGENLETYQTTYPFMYGTVEKVIESLSRIRDDHHAGRTDFYSLYSLSGFSPRLTFFSADPPPGFGLTEGLLPILFSTHAKKLPVLKELAENYEKRLAALEKDKNDFIDQGDSESAQVVNARLVELLKFLRDPDLITNDHPDAKKSFDQLLAEANEKLGVPSIIDFYGKLIKALENADNLLDRLRLLSQKNSAKDIALVMAQLTRDTNSPLVFGVTGNYERGYGIAVLWGDKRKGNVVVRLKPDVRAPRIWMTNGGLGDHLINPIPAEGEPDSNSQGVVCRIP